MLLCKVVVIAVIVSFTNAQYNGERYVIPEPKIEAFYPKGFRVSIEDSPGVRLFAFHGNINRELRDLEAGTLSKDILHKQNGRWAFEERNVRLEVGNTINYWLFVIKDGLGYRLDDGVFTVRELTSPFTSDPVQTTTPANQNHAETDNNNAVNSQLPPSGSSSPSPLGASSPSASPSPSGASSPSSTNNDAFGGVECQASILNITSTLLNFQAKIEELTKTNEQLTKVIERFQGAKQLTLSGRIPPDGDAAMTVTFMLREKLDLNPDIASATRNSDNSITFEVTTIVEKLKILEVAKEKLKDSRIIIR